MYLLRNQCHIIIMTLNLTLKNIMFVNPTVFRTMYLYENNK